MLGRGGMATDISSYVDVSIDTRGSLRLQLKSQLSSESEQRILAPRCGRQQPRALIAIQDVEPVLFRQVMANRGAAAQKRRTDT